jgi:hypothetical protein
MLPQLLCHLWGDYIAQSHWMAANKRLRWDAATLHASAYTCCFLPIAWHQPLALAVVLATHLLIDRFGLARYLVWAKNWLGPMTRTETWEEAVERHRRCGILPQTLTKLQCDEIDADRRTYTSNLPFDRCQPTGNPPGTPDYMAAWLTIIADNTLHLTINFLALRYL